MSNENPGKNNWKNKLEQGEGLAGEILGDKNATWEKLYHRLQPKRRKVRSVWYWAAAAGILTAVMIPLLTATKKQQDLVKTQAQQPVQTNKSVEQMIPVRQQQKEVAVAGPATEKKAISTIGIHQKGEFKSSKNISQTTAIVPIELTNLHESESIHTPDQLVQDLPVAKAIALLRTIQKLKVVHVNELGDPLPETHNRNIADYHTVQIKLINQEVYTKVSANNPGVNFFKTTNAPSN